MRVSRITDPYTHTSVRHSPHGLYLGTSLAIALMIAILVVTSVTIIVEMILN